MESVFIVVVLLVLFFVFVQKRYLKQDELKDSAYKKKGPLMNMQESAFYNALMTAVGQHGIVMAKVNMANIVAPLATDKKPVSYTHLTLPTTR